MGEPTVLSETADFVTRITINRPDRRNALNDDVVAALAAAFEAAQADDACRVIVLSGAGDRAFCAGGDLKAGVDGGPFVGDLARPNHSIARMFGVMDACTKPIIARVNGHAMGGGTGLVCACDIAVMTERAKIGTPEVKIGLFPMTILPPMLRVVPRRQLMEMFVTGEPWSAAQALEYGIVNYVTDAAGLDAKVTHLTDLIVARSPTAVRLGKYACHAVGDMTYPQQLHFAETMLPRMAMTDDAKEGFDAFVTKRAPEWTGN